MENYSKAIDLLQQLQDTIRSQQEEINKLRSRVKLLKDQNDELRKERDDLRVKTNDQLGTIAELTRRHSLNNPPPSPKHNALKRYPSSPSPSFTSRLPSLPLTNEDRETTEELQSSPQHAEIVPVVLEPSSPPVTLRGRPRSRYSEDKRQAVYVTTPPTFRKELENNSLTEQEKEEEIAEEEEEEELEEQKEAEEEEDNSLSTSITPVPLLVSPIPGYIGSNLHGSNMSINSTDLSSNEGSTTSIDTEQEARPDLVSPSSSLTSSFGSSLPGTPVLTTIEPAQGRRSMGSPFHPMLESIGSDDVEDYDGENTLTISYPAMRSRLATVGARVHLTGKGKAHAPRKVPSLRRQNSFPRRGRKSYAHDQNYLSPDMEMKIQQMIQQALGKKFGGFERATRAAVTIQRAYRKYKIDAHFRMIRKLQHDSLAERRRTMSVRHNRAPSILRKKLHNVSSPGADKMEEMRDKFKNITQTRLSPSISKRELRSKPSNLVVQIVEPPAEVEQQHKLENGIPINDSLLEIPEEPSPDEIIVFSLTEEDQDTTCLQKSYSADLLERARMDRSPSVFSGLSLQSLQEMFSPDHQAPGMARQMSSSVLKRKTNIGVNIFNRKPQKGVQYLVYHEVIKDDPFEVAKFMKCHYGLSKEKIGEFVGEIRYDFNMAVLEYLVEMIDLNDKPIDEALRSFQQLFRMPGEAQKIDKIMQVFAAEYYQYNKDGIIKSEDAAYILSFAIMMLHTDLHNPSVRRHMTKKDWLRMNRGTNDNENYPEDYLLTIYDRIQHLEFTTGRDHTHEVAEIRKQIIGTGCPPLLNTQRRFIGQFDVFQVNDMHKRHIRKHRRSLFLFNDVLLVLKNVASNKYEYRKSFTLLNTQAMEFHTNNYKHGVFIQHELNGETYHCNCDNESEKTRLLSNLSEAIFELKEMERERIGDFGFKNSSYKDSESVNNPQGSDLLSSKSLSSSADNLHLMSKDDIDFRRVATTNATDSLKRSSKDSGFDSPQTTSPSPNGTGVTSSSYLTTTSPKRSGVEQPRSRTPEPKRVMTVVPDAAVKRSLTLRPESSPSKKKERLSTPPDTFKPDSSPRKNKGRLSTPPDTFKPDSSRKNKGRLSTPPDVSQLQEHTSPSKSKKSKTFSSKV